MEAIDIVPHLVIIHGNGNQFPAKTLSTVHSTIIQLYLVKDSFMPSSGCQYVNTDKEGDRRIGITGDLSMGRRFSIFLDDFSTFFRLTHLKWW